MDCPVCGHQNLPGAADCEECLSSLTLEDDPQAFGRNRMEVCLLEEKVKSLSPSDPLVVSERMTLDKAVQLMRDCKAGCLLVTREDGALSGILTEGILLRSQVFEKEELCEFSVGEFMRPSPETIRSEHLLAYAFQRMIVADIRYLPLVDEAAKPVGLVTSSSIIEFIEKNCPRANVDAIP